MNRTDKEQERDELKGSSGRERVDSKADLCSLLPAAMVFQMGGRVLVHGLSTATSRLQHSYGNATVGMECTLEVAQAVSAQVANTLRDPGKSSARGILNV